MQPDTLSLLRNPYTGEKLRLEAGKLISDESGRSFPIRNGIPNFLSEISLQGRNRRFRWFYDRVAFAYDYVLDLGNTLKINTERAVRQEYISRMEISPRAKALETAVGTASNILLLPESGDYYGLDISWQMLRRAQRKLESADRKAELFQGDGAFLPFRDDAFDIVFQMGGLQFYSDPLRGVIEMARVAKPGAWVHVIDEVRGASAVLKRSRIYLESAASKKTATKYLPRLVPKKMINVLSQRIPNSDFYALTFRKPG